MRNDEQFDGHALPDDRSFPDTVTLARTADGRDTAVVGDHVPPPFDADDLRRALRLAYPPDEADEFAGVLAQEGLHAPGSVWTGETLLLVALLSPAHEARMQAWLGWTSERMTGELQRLRTALAS